MTLFTTPIYYVNASPHIGHAYTTVAADVLARAHRQRGRETFLLTGCDEHGEPVARAAAAAGIDPQAFVDANAAEFERLIGVCDVAPDAFVRTSSAAHGAVVQRLLTDLYEQGIIRLGHYQGWYCPRCADFRVVRADEEAVCDTHKIALERQSEPNYFFPLGDYTERIRAHLDDHPDWVWPRSRANELRALLDADVPDISLTRTSTDWGVRCPWDPDHVFYVWFDALLNYISGPEAAGVTDTWPAGCQLLGKDILKFHGLIWPALLLALDLPLPERLVVHGYLLNRGHKISKSLGNVIDPFEVAELVGSDALRWTLTYALPWGGDGTLDDTDSFRAGRVHLADEYGNLVRRVSTLAARHGTLPAHDLHPAIAEAGLDALLFTQEDALDRHHPHDAAQAVASTIRTANALVNDLRPWEADDGGRLVGSLCEVVRAITARLHAFCPAATTIVASQWGFECDWEAAHVRERVPAADYRQLPVLFPKG